MVRVRTLCSIFIGCLVVLLTGCMTAKMAGSAAEELGKGNVGVGLFALALTPIMIVPDILTLGGTTDPAVVMGGAASVAAKNSSDKNAAQYQALATSINQNVDPPPLKADPSNLAMCLTSVPGNPSIKFNRCSYDIFGVRCRSGAAVANCLGTKDQESNDFRAGRRQTSILHNEKSGVLLSQTIFCRFGTKPQVVDEFVECVCIRGTTCQN